MALNDLCSNWSSVLADVPQGSVFLDNLESTVKLFADDTSLFLNVYDPNMLIDQLDKDLKKNSDWAY